MKKNEVAKRMARVELGSKAKRNFAYRIEDHKGNLLKEGGSKKGRASLNPAQKNRDDSEGQKSYKQEDK